MHCSRRVQLVVAEIAFSAASARGGGLASMVTDEMQRVVQPALADTVGYQPLRHPPGDDPGHQARDRFTSAT